MQNSFDANKIIYTLWIASNFHQLKCIHFFFNLILYWNMQKNLFRMKHKTFLHFVWFALLFSPIIFHWALRLLLKVRQSLHMKVKFVEIECVRGNTEEKKICYDFSIVLPGKDFHNGKLKPFLLPCAFQFGPCQYAQLHCYKYLYISEARRQFH